MFSNRPAVNGDSPDYAQREEQAPVATIEAIGGISGDVYQIRDRVQRIVQERQRAQREKGGT